MWLSFEIIGCSVKPPDWLCYGLATTQEFAISRRPALSCYPFILHFFFLEASRRKLDGATPLYRPANMMPGFGFSVGDFIAAAGEHPEISCWSLGLKISCPGLIKKVSDALKDAGGASSDYQYVIIELEGLDRALKVVAALQPDHNNDSHLNAIRGMALSCQLPLRQFLFKIQKYEGSLGAIPSSRSIPRNARKAKWAVYIADQVQSLRAVIAAKVASINLLLNVQISYVLSSSTI